jgi:two-component system alkaline phosphatase synthesis response regulator PhoP
MRALANYRILVVEDDRPIAELLKYRLIKEGYDVEIAETGSKALRLTGEWEPNLMLLDWRLPDISGLDVCQQVTQSNRIPIIMVTARNMVEDKVLGLEAGADDYITKPFDVREVVARIKATFRRLETAESAPASGGDVQLEFAGLNVAVSTMTVYKNGRAVELTPLEYQLLMYFYENRNKALTRETILHAVWGYEYFGNTRTVDIHVLRLRKKLDLEEKIRTIFKIGYIFDAEAAQGA